jgi:Leucine-rich repeat (LRR) protein
MAHKRIKEASVHQRPWLVLERLGLTELPDEVFTLTHLDELIVIDNLLDRIPPEIKKLEKLTRICVFYNEITELPAEIGYLKNLTHLDLSCNKLECLPVEIRQLSRLTYLDLRYNCLPIPEKILENVNQPEQILNAYFEETAVKAGD